MQVCNDMSCFFRNTRGEYKVRSTSPEYYEWKIFKNPYHKGKLYLEYDKDLVTGSTTITPKQLSISGAKVKAAELGDGFTHRNYRGRGVFARGVNACTEFALSQGIEVIYGTPNSLSLNILQSGFGYLPCPFVNFNIMMKRYITLPSLMKSIAKLVLHRKLRPSETPIAMLKQIFSRLHFLRLKNRARNECFNISTLETFTGNIDGLWGGPRYGFFNIRDKTYLNWRYFSNPDEYQFMAAMKGSEYLGYIVTKLSKDRKIGIICDFITIDDRLDIFQILIQEAEKMFKKARVSSIRTACVAGSPYHQILKSHNYLDESRYPVIIYSGSDYGKKLLNEDVKWHFTFSDSDDI